MQQQIDRMVRDYEGGRLSRRQLVAHLSGMAAALAAGAALAQDQGGGRERQDARQDDDDTDDAAANETKPTFSATGLDHIALRVTDIGRSRDWYMKHLGLTISRQSRSSCFMNCGDHFVAMFLSETAGLDHYSYALADYNPDDAVARLKDAGLEPVRHGNRVYFDDPDGITVQVSRG